MIHQKIYQSLSKYTSLKIQLTLNNIFINKSKLHVLRLKRFFFSNDWSQYISCDHIIVDNIFFVNENTHKNS